MAVAKTPKALTIHADYLRAVTQEPDAVIRAARIKLADVDFDTIVGTGLSGALIVPRLAKSMRKKWMIVRKSDDRSTHSAQVGEGTLGKRWLFVDDLICSGNTWRRTKEQIRHVCAQYDYTTTYVGAYLYADQLFEEA